MIRNQNNSLRVGHIKRATSRNSPPGLVSMSLDLKKNLKNKALLLNQPSVDDNIYREQDLNFNLNQIKADRGSFFTGSGSITADGGNKSVLQKTRQQKDAD